MPANTRAVQMAFLVLGLSMLVLHSGCGTSGGGADAPTTNPAAELRLDLSTTSGLTTVEADGRSTIPIRLQVTNGLGAGLPGTEVTFATTAGTLSQSPVVRASRAVLGADEVVTPRQDGEERLTVTTDATGTAQVLLTPGTQAGTAIVTADVQGFRTNIVINFVPGPSSRVQLDASPITVNPGGTSTLTATVTDANGNLVPGETVVFAFSTNTSGAGLDPVSGTTDSNGQIAVMYTAGITAGADTIQARATETGVTGSTSITVTVSQVVSQVASITVTAGALSIVANGTSTVAIRATVGVSSGAPVGIPVTFLTTAGSLAPAMASTNADGMATVTLTAASSLGTATVTASAGGFSATTTVMFVAGPTDMVQLSVNPATVNGGETATLTAAVTDATGNPVSGETLTLSFSTNTSGATLSALSGPTDTNGQFMAMYTAGATPGTDTVQARATNGMTDTVNITVASSPAGSVASITLVVTESSGTPNDNTIAANGSATATITATLNDASGRPVINGVVVNFMTTLGSVTSQATTTGGNGIATASFTAGTVAGNATVTAMAGTITSAPVVITLAAGPVNSLVLVDISTTFVGVRGSGTNETANLTFEARDSNGNLVQDPIPGDQASGTMVSFTLESGGLGGGESLSPTRVTAVNGRVTTTLQSGTRAGTVRVIAFIDTPPENSLPDGTEIASQAISVVITGGPPWGENLSVAVNPLNIAGLVTFGLTDTITTFLSDRFSNPVPDGTAVSFFSDFAGITGAAVSMSAGGTTAATAVATLTSQGPLPPDGFVTVTPSTLSGPDARVLSIAVNPANANVVYAGTDGGGVFQTTNGLNADPAQTSWTQVGRAQTGLTNGIVRDVQIDPTNTSVIYAATDGGVFRSTGGGDTWQERNGRERITGEAPVPVDTAGMLCPGCQIGTIPSTGLPQNFLLAFPSSRNRARTIVRINGVETRLYEFVDARAIQLLPGAGLPDDIVNVDYDLDAVIGAARVTALALDPTDPLPAGADPATSRTLYAGTQGAGVFRSRDSGFSWEGINNGLSNPDVLSLVALNATTLYAGTFGGGVFRTFNATDPVPIWCQVNTGLTSTVINTLATDGTRVYAGTFLGGVFFLADGTSGGVTDCRTVAGPSWTAPTTNVNTLDILNGFVSDIVIAPNDIATLYAATLGDGTRSIEGNAAEGGVFRSADSGVTWTRIPALPAVGTQLALPPTDLPNNRAASLGIAAVDAETAALYVGVAGRNVVRLAPSTTTYTVINGTPPNQLTNNIFVSGTVLFSGNTRVTLTEVSDSFQDQNREPFPDGFGPLPDSDIFNAGLQSFIYTVADQNGNPIAGGSTVTVAASAGSLTGNTSVTIPDAQRGFTVFGVAWQNDLTTAGNTSATLTVSVDSQSNGSASASVSRLLIGPLTITPTNGSVPPGGGSLAFNVNGGSETLVSQGGGYSISPSAGTISSVATFVCGATTCIDGPGSFTLTTNATTNNTTITITIRDRINGQQVLATVTQALNPIVISPTTGSLPGRGGTLIFSVNGGSQTGYSITSSGGMISPPTLNAPGNFTLTTNAITNGTTITVTVTDSNGLQGIVTATQAVNPVVITPSSATLPAGGGSVSFMVSGGTETGYSLTTTAGTTIPNMLNGPGSFTLITDAAADGATITVTATDITNPTTQSAAATVTQQSPP